jgi:hypothetical protein
LVSDKIEGGDSKRKVVRIHFGHPMKKNGLGYNSPWEVAMTGVAAVPAMGSSLGKEGKGRGKESRRHACSIERRKGHHYMVSFSVASERRKRRKEKRRKGRKKRKKERERKGKIF